MSLFDGAPRRRGILLWRWQYTWQPQTNAGALLFIGAIMLFVGSIFIAIMGTYVYRAHRLASEGKFTTGTVVKKVMHQASDSGTSNTSYEVDYSFTTAAGLKVEGNDTIDPDVWDQLKESGPVQIEYAASKPRINQVGATSGPIIIGYIVVVVASVIWLLGATLAVKGLRGPWSAPARSGKPETHSDSGVVFNKGRVEVDLPPFLKDKVTPWTFFGILLLICGAMFLLIGAANLRQERAFRAEGKPATAIVLTKSSHQEYDQQNETYETHYDLDYRFTTDDGKSARGSAEVNWRTWRSINERDPIQIIYLPQRPTRSRLASDHPGFFLWFVTVLGGLLTGGGVIVLGYGMFDTARRRRRS
jgi:Protein of unknown function (DUF3592)